MGRPVVFLLVVSVLAASLAAGGELRFTEIMYHPPEGEHLEFLELTAVEGGDFTGYAIDGGVSYRFPAGLLLENGQAVVLAADPAALREHYADAYPLEPLAYSRSLSNAGEEILLLDPDGHVLERVAYDDDPPWDFLADGFGPSLNRLCLSASAEEPRNWEAQEPTPSRPGARTECPPPDRPPPPVVINEIMYHPNGATVDDSVYEYVELHNRTDETHDLAGWTLAGGIVYTFAAGDSLAPRGYLVVAADPAALRSVYPDLAPGDVTGPFLGQLDNGGAKVALLGPDGAGMDAVTYDDDFPWPILPDGYGELTGRGASLERRCAEEPAGLVANWASSPLDAPTPGRANAGQTCTLPVVPTALETAPSSIGPADPITVTVRFSEDIEPAQVRLVYLLMQMPDDPVEPEAEVFSTSAGGLVATIPAQPAGTVIRWRVERLAADSWQPVAPRADDPFRVPWYGLFVPPPSAATVPTYHLLVSPENWARIHQNALNGRAVAGQPLESWNESVSALFAYENHLYDVRLRYQGSQWHRHVGFDISDAFTCPGPVAGAQTYPVRLVSYRIGFPRYDQFAGRQAVILNKQHQQRDDSFLFHGLQLSFGFRLFRAAGVPAPDTRFVQVTMNGCPYHLMLEIERPGDEMLERYFAGEGDLFKATGCPRDVSWGLCTGPFDWADGRRLEARDGWTAPELYAASYERKTRTFDDHAVLQELIENLEDIRGENDPALLRAALEDRFSVDTVLRYLAVSNWGCAWDDIWQNYFLYREAPANQWHLLPWDLDQMYGGPCCCTQVHSRISVWRGRSDCPDNWRPDGFVPEYNRFKDSFLRAFPDEYFFRLVELNNGLFRPEPLLEWIGEEASVVRAEASRVLLPIEPRLDSYEQRLRDFVIDRHAYINELAIPAVEPGDDVLAEVGIPVAFDGSASEPPSGPDVAYSWSTGGTGDRPTAVFLEPVTHEVTLTITRTFRSGGEEAAVERSAGLYVRVLPSPACIVEGEGGIVAIEAEAFGARHGGVRSFTDYAWELEAAPDSSGGQALRATGERRVHDTRYDLHAPEVDYWFRPDRSGFHYLWIRAKADGAAAEYYLYAGLDHDAPARTEPIVVPGGGGEFTWVRNEGFLIEPGRRYALLSVWLGDPTVIIDKLVLSADLASPTGEGPPASVTHCAQEFFVRGDSNGDGTVNVADAVATLLVLFNGEDLVDCEDRADVNDDGTVNIADPIAVLGYLFTNGTPPRHPFPAPGLDPTRGDPYPCGDGP